MKDIFRQALNQPPQSAPDGRKGSIVLVGTGPGAADLLTLRALNRLREAEVIFYDRLVDPEVLELANPKAERVYVGKAVGNCAWPQDKICEMIVAEALKGRRVLRLKSGDPGIFGRATEELEAARAEGIAVEIVPGVTAACAAAAAAGRSLTERGVSDALVLTTGMNRAGDPLPEATRHAQPGTAYAFYMAVAQATRIRDGLIGLGLPGTAPVTVAVEVSKPDQRVLECTLETLPETLEQQGIIGCATLLVTWPKADAATQNAARRNAAKSTVPGA
ncbi:MAG: uroporphyrinogen-III C-methyltransferase [Paracoccaceae bacterium]